MSTATTVFTSDGVIRQQVLSIAADGNALTINLGFQPRRVKLYDPAGVITWEWVQGLPTGDSFKSSASALAVDTTGELTVTSKDAETAAAIAAGTIEPGVTIGATALTAGHTLILYAE